MDNESSSKTSVTTSPSEVQVLPVAAEEVISEGVSSSLCSLDLKWTFGQTCFIPIISMQTVGRSTVLFASGHVAVVFDWIKNTQLLLQGHRNNIACIAATKNKRWIATADKGPNNVFIIWDSQNGLPLKIVYDFCPLYGIETLEFSEDSKYLVTISADPLQVVSIWDWSSEDDNPLISLHLKNNFGILHHIAFHPLCSDHFVATGERRVVFFHLVSGELKYFAPRASEKDFKRPLGRFTQSGFQSGSENAITATTLGGFLLWGSAKLVGKTAKDNLFVLPEDRQVIRLIHPLQQKVSITVLTSIGNFVAAGDEKGHVHIFDKNLKLVIWYSDFNLDSISAISFMNDPSVFKDSLFPSEPLEATSESSSSVAIPDFLVGTRLGYCGHVSIKSAKMTFVHQGCPFIIRAITCHHQKPHLCIGDYEGFILLWDYQERKLESSCQLSTSCKEIQCLAFDPSGVYLAVGLTDGKLLVLDVPILTETPTFQFQGSKYSVLLCTFSPDSNYLAMADASNAVTVFKLHPEPLKSGRGKSNYLVEPGWEFFGKQRPHFRIIIDLLFNKPSGDHYFLFSLGKDRYLVIYDVLLSMKEDLKIHRTINVEQTSLPLCMTWYPFYREENLIAIGNDEFKLKIHDIKKEMCIKTVLEPIHQTPIKRMKIAHQPAHRQPKLLSKLGKENEEYMVYATEQQLGVTLVPADGNPHRSLGIVGHPMGILCMEMSFCGKLIFSAGEDGCVHMWQVNLKAVNAAASLGGTDMVPFYNLLPGGEFGKWMEDLKDYLYYIQIKRFGDDYMETMLISDHIPIEELPNIMSALGFYPSNYEITLLLNDAAFTKVPKNEVNLNDTIKLYINHSPAFGTRLEQLSWAFRVLGNLGQQEEEGDTTIPRQYLVKCFIDLGEAFSEEELTKALMVLTNKWPYSEKAVIVTPASEGEGRALLDFEQLLPQRVTFYTFLTDVLGFQLDSGAVIVSTPEKIRV